ncbi:hypothetical protein HV824_35695 [Myxococcus sp. AM009]|uniref:hypothetical protein n=1 Tax=Myxococcus sp. AM009 TaxID=2745137 RepID=UPI00159521C1|nr:hypothetical protein [Myxococcus sp. AM009]NVJ03411.1 hypothetical protein [Myxococcus sp. AM009]
MTRGPRREPAGARLRIGQLAIDPLTFEESMVDGMPIVWASRAMGEFWERTGTKKPE